MANREKSKPGIMLYFDDLRPAITRLSNEQAGLLLRAMLAYGEYGEVPDELDAVTGIVFEMLRPHLDRDAERYEEAREQRRYAVYCREQQRAGLSPVDISEWRCSCSCG